MIKRINTKKGEFILLISLIMLITISASIFLLYKNFIKVNSSKLETIALKYFNDNNIDCNSYCEVSTSTLIKKGYLNTKINNEEQTISFSTLSTGEQISNISTYSTDSITAPKITSEANTENLTGVTVRHINSNNNPSVTYTDNSVTINQDGEYGYAGWEYDFTNSNLENYKVYVITANITTTNLDLKRDFGANLRQDYSYNIYAHSNSYETINTNTTKEIKMTIMKTPYNSGDFLKVKILLGDDNYGGQYYAKGTMKVNSISIRKIIDEINDDEVHIGSSSNNRIKVVYWKNNYDYIIKTSIDETRFQNYMDRYGNVYDKYAEITGQTSRSSNILLPDGGNPIFIMMTNCATGAFAFAGNPIQVHNNAAIEDLEMAKNDANNNMMSWGTMHELGHVFTIFKLSDPNNSNITTLGTNLSNFDSELTASFIPPLYAIYKLNYHLSNQSTMYEEGTTYIYDGKDENKSAYDYLLWTADIVYNKVTKDGFNRKNANNWHGLGLIYLLEQVTTDNGIVDFEAYKNVYKWFNDISSDKLSYVNNNSKKFLWFIKKLDDYSNKNVINYFNEHDLNIILTQYGSTYNPITSIRINNNNFDNTMKLTIDPSDYNDVVVYTSDSNTTVDDFGNIKINGTPSNITLNARSFLNPSIKTSKTINNNVKSITINNITKSPSTIYNNTSNGTITIPIITENIDDTKLNVNIKNSNGTNVNDKFNVSGNTISNNSATVKITFNNVSADTYTVETSSGDIKATTTFKIEEYKYVTDITLKKDGQTIQNNITITSNKNAEITISASVNEDAINKTLKWSSSNEEVATVDQNGKITTKERGTAKITVSPADGSNITKTININVIEPKIESITKTITTNNGTNHIYNNSSSTVTLKVKTEDISDAIPLNVTIKEGTTNVTNKFTISGNTVNNNSATIQIKTPSNININSDTEYTVEVSYSESVQKTSFTIKKYINVTNIKLTLDGKEISDNDTINLKINETKTINTTIEPNNATNKNLTWTNNNPNIVTVDNGVIRAVGIGSTTITVRTTDGSNITKTININVSQMDAPTIKATLGDSNETYKSGNLTNKPVKITLSSNESNVQYKYSDDNKQTWKPFTNGTKFENINKTIYFKLTYNNENSQISEIKINSDTTPPKINIKYKKYKETTQSTELQDTDKTFDYRTTIYINTDDQTATLKYELSNEIDNQPLDVTATNLCDTCNSIDLTKNTKYNLHVEVTDEAGNKTEAIYNLTIMNSKYYLNLNIQNGTYNNSNSLNEEIDNTNKSAKFTIISNTHYEYKKDNLSCKINNTNEKIDIDYEYDANNGLNISNLSKIQDDIDCELKFEEKEYKVEIEHDEKGTIKDLEKYTIKQKNSEIKQYTLEISNGYLYKSFICDNANVEYDEQNKTVTISEVNKDGTCKYETIKETTEIPIINSITGITQEDKEYTSNVWSNKGIKIDVEALDINNNEVKEIQYRYSKDNEWKSYTSGTTFENINDTIYFKAIDWSGNESRVHTIIVKSDTVAPTTPKINAIIKDTNDEYVSSSFTNKVITISLDSIDNGSGLNRYEYKIGESINNNSGISQMSNTINKYKIKRLSDSEWIEVKDNKIELKDINNVVYFRSIDNAGNISAVSYITINSDTTQMPVNNTTTNDKINNPQTGINYPIIGISLILIGGISIILYSRKSNRFPNV